MNDYIVVIGGGLAGSEAAYQIAKRGIKVKLYEMKPHKFSPAHHNENLAEIVCSNSFKSNLHTNACGLLKEELRRLDSLLIRVADETAVPAGQALAVDREIFSKRITEELEKLDNIEIIRREVGCAHEHSESSNDNNAEIQKLNKNSNDYIETKKDLNEDIYKNNKENTKNVKEIDNEIATMAKGGIVIIATGPLTSEGLSKEIAELTGEDKLYFYDAAAPIIEKDSIDDKIAFWGDRYEQERKKEETVEEWLSRRSKDEEKNYINLPMNKEEYEAFYEELINSEVVTLHDFEKRELFEGCMPIEIMAKRGKDTLRYGPLKPVGFTDPRTGRRPYAVVQLRQDNSEGNLFNMVGFQTNLKFGEQQRVFSMIPGLKNANFVKFGVMHRNTYINSTKLLNQTYQMKENPNIYFAGQITGVEGYVESVSSGMVAGLNAVRQFENAKKGNMNQPENNENKIVSSMNNVDNSSKEKIIFPDTTMIGALSKYISTENERFQPMNANFGILPQGEERIKDKKLKYTKLADKALKDLEDMLKQRSF